MKEYLNNHISIALTLLLIAGAVFLGAWVSHYKQQELEINLREKMETQRAYMFSLAEITDRNGADEAIANIIVDCPRREEYESYLITLGTLSKKELVILQNIFESCGSFYAERKALMVAKLERELQSYKDLGGLLLILTDSKNMHYEYEKWTELVSLEKSRSTLLTDQSILQSKIISALISGASVASKEVSTLVGEAQSINELLMVNGQKIDAIRNSLQH